MGGWVEGTYQEGFNEVPIDEAMGVRNGFVGEKPTVVFVGEAAGAFDDLEEEEEVGGWVGGWVGG